MRSLNAADYFTLVMDEEIRNDGLAGGLGGVVLELAGQPDIGLLEKRIEEFVQKFPEATECLQQHGRRFFWCNPRQSANIFFKHQSNALESNDVFNRNCLENIMNRKETREEMFPLEFHLISGTETHLLLMRWLHPLCDAKGADLILKYLCEQDFSKRAALGHSRVQLVDEYLRKLSWWRTAIDFVKAKQYIQTIDKKNSILPSNDAISPKRMSYHIFHYNQENTQLINRQIRANVGLIGSTLYFIGCFMRAIEKAGPATDGDAYCAPYAFNLRKQKAVTPIFGNQVSVLFSQADRSIVADRKLLFKHLKKQNADAIRNKMDFAFLPTMWAGSWLSLEKYGRILRFNHTGRERCSFWFSDIGQIDMPDRAFFGTAISSIFHLCQITSPPSLALLVGQCCGQLTLSFNYLRPQINDNWMKQLQLHMDKELLGILD